MHLRMDGKRDCSCPHACPPLLVFSYLWQLGGRCFPWGKIKWRTIKELSMHTELAEGSGRLRLPPPTRDGGLGYLCCTAVTLSLQLA